MNIEKVCVSLSLAKQLKEAGYPQKESLFWWVDGEMQFGYEGEWSVRETENETYFLFDHVVDHDFTGIDFEVDAGDMGISDDEFDQWEKRKKKKEKLMMKKILSAPTAEELLKMLPIKIGYKELGLEMTYGNTYIKIAHEEDNSWVVFYENDQHQMLIDEIAADEILVNALAKMFIYLKNDLE